jgi:hypothetical protein
MAFDLSAAFDTVAAEQLAPTLRMLGITGRELKWFLCYMSGGKQCVVWDGMVSTSPMSSTESTRGQSSDP